MVSGVLDEFWMKWFSFKFLLGLLICMGRGGGVIRFFFF